MSGWIEVPFSRVPQLRQYSTPSEWPRLKEQLKAPVKGGSYAFAKDEQGCLWFIEIDPFGDETRYYKKVERSINSAL